ncbi:hypothetical protein HMPREF1141_0853 [Clostridium sp. MSTE9]|nr:hypothetical protein HMPREF1141_0853 [Clostridium sp. MSTE9]
MIPIKRKPEPSEIFHPAPAFCRCYHFNKYTQKRRTLTNEFPLL